MSNGKATAGLVLSIIGFVFFPFAIVFGILGLIFSINGLRKFSQDPQLGGKGVSIAGIIISSISLLIWILIIPLIMIGAYAYFGVLDPSNLVPDSCTAGSGFTCAEYVANDDSIAVMLVNSLDTVTIESLSDISAREYSSTGCNLQPAGASDVLIENVAYSATNNVVNPGDSLTMTFPCSGSIGVGERVQAEIDFDYRRGTSTLTQTASISVSVQNN